MISKKVKKNLGMSEKDLIPVTTRVQAANMDQDALVSYIESTEAGKHSILRISRSQSAAAARSSHHNQWNSSLRENTEKCSHCGTISHGDGSNRRTRKEKCPAYGQTCTKCTRMHHLSSVCKSKHKPQPQPATPNDTTAGTSATVDKQDGAFSSICSINSDTTLGLHSVILDHHLYDNMCNRWSRQFSKAQPFIKLAMSTHKDDYQALGFTMTCPPTSCTIQGMADTGCQSCLCGLQIIRKLGMSEKDLISVTMRVHAANKQDIGIPGAAIVTLCGISKTSKQLETRQILYITDNTDKLFISREACIALGMISKDFPAIGEMASLDISSQPSIICECPRRRPPPLRLTVLPFPATQENIPKLKQYLLDYYR